MDEQSELFVTYWPDPGAGKVFFTFGKRWVDVSDVFGFRIRDDAAGNVRRSLFTQVSNVQQPQGGIERDRTAFQPGAFNATWLDPAQPPTVFVVARRPGTRFRLPLIGSAAAVEAELKLLAQAAPNMHVDRCELADDPYRRPSDIARRAQRTARAASALEALSAGTLIRTAIHGLEVSELTWLAYEAAEARIPEAFRVIAEAALAKEVTISTLNLCGSAYRAWQPTRSLERFQESIDLVRSAAYNPYGWIGMAATLRRLHEHDRAYDCVKRALKFYPDNEYALRVKRALLREMPGYRVYRNARPEDEAPSLIQELPLLDDVNPPNDPEPWPSTR